MNRKNGTPGIMRIGEEISYSLDTRATGVNNNVLVVGSSGSGKTTGVVICVNLSLLLIMAGRL